MQISYRDLEDTRTLVAWIGSAALGEFCSLYVPGVAVTKMLHPDLMTAPFDCQMQLLRGWLRGDGGASQETRNRFKLTGTSASERLARQMFAIAVRCGLRPSFKRRQNNFDVYFASEDSEKLGWTVPAKHFRSGRRIIAGHTLARVREVRTASYNGPVWDIDVDGDNF